MIYLSFSSGKNQLQPPHHAAFGYFCKEFPYQYENTVYAYPKYTHASKYI